MNHESLGEKGRNHESRRSNDSASTPDKETITPMTYYYTVFISMVRLEYLIHRFKSENHFVQHNEQHHRKVQVSSVHRRKGPPLEDLRNYVQCVFKHELNWGTTFTSHAASSTTKLNLVAFYYNCLMCYCKISKA